MKHSAKVTLILIAMFFITQLIGLAVVQQYSPQIEQVTDDQGNINNLTTYNLPYGLDPPETTKGSIWRVVFFIAISLIFAVLIMFALMKYGAELLIKIWFFSVIVIALGITLNAFLFRIPYGATISLVMAAGLAYIKLIKRNIIAHNLTELIIYPGIGAIFVALILSWTSKPVLAGVAILIFLSIYDIYAVWHAGFMQKMAHFQINKLKLFTGFFVPYMNNKEKNLIKKAKTDKKLKNKKVKVNVAILGGGDVVFPIILAGIVLNSMGIIQALLISVGATIALAWLFAISKKGKFYPAMPFISIGCFIALGIAYFI
jgi:presenilin-like A22 family membrane protease